MASAVSASRTVEGALAEFERRTGGDDAQQQLVGRQQDRQVDIELPPIDSDVAHDTRSDSQAGHHQIHRAMIGVKPQLGVVERVQRVIIGDCGDHEAAQFAPMASAGVIVNGHGLSGQETLSAPVPARLGQDQIGRARVVVDREGARPGDRDGRIQGALDVERVVAGSIQEVDYLDRTAAVVGDELAVDEGDAAKADASGARRPYRMLGLELQLTSGVSAKTIRFAETVTGLWLDDDLRAMWRITDGIIEVLRIPLMNIPVTAQICLTEFRIHDKATCVERIGDQEIYDRTLRIPHPYTEEHFDQWLGVVVEATERHGEPVHFAIREGDSLIGSIGFDGLAMGHRAEIGYWLAKPWWGRGIMTAVVGKACQYAISRWNLVRITAHVFESNLASVRVLEKNGFACEGLLRKHHLKDGQFLNSRLFALVR